MKLKIKKKLRSLVFYLRDLIYFYPMDLIYFYSGYLPIFYYSRIKNVGDILNPYMIEKLTGRKSFLIKERRISHLLPIGSIMHFATKNSNVWGSGVIDPNQLPDVSILPLVKFSAVRGELTKVTLQEAGALIDDVVLGDPAVLLPEFYQPNKILKRYRLGVVPHYVDFNNEILEKYASNPNVLIIDVKQNPESFVDMLVSCDFIISSSLHGLILSDAYCVPNAWIRFGDGIIGGSFKFLDYYTTTDRFTKNIEITCSREPNLIEGQDSIDLLVENIGLYCRVNKYIYDKVELIDSFPKKFKY